MKRLLLISALVLAPALALAQQHTAFHIAIARNVRLAPVRPGVQVFLDLDEDVFYSQEQYWVHRDGDWYHAVHHRDAFTYVEPESVPQELLTLSPGEYAHHAPMGGHDDDDYGYDDYGSHAAHHASGGCGGH
jgi:hypothetical protein